MTTEKPEPKQDPRPALIVPIPPTGSPPSHPTTIGTVWTGETRPRLAEFADGWVMSQEPRH